MSCPKYRVPKDLREKLAKERMKLAEFFRSINLVSERVINAFLRVPREEFVRPEYVQYAYVDTPLPLYDGATISAPSMCLLFCEYANLREGMEVFEVGTGSGYQAALIAELVCNKTKKYERKPVCTMEISQKLYEFGKDNLERLCYSRFVDVRLGDATLGWPEKDRKFDVIIVTAAGTKIPPPWVRQLKVGGIILMPLEVGSDWQVLIKAQKISEPDKIKIEHLEPVRFVYLKGKYGVF